MMRQFLFALLYLGTCISAVAGEGMWLPVLLGQLNEKEMRTMGMRITAEDIYSVNHSSLKDAVVLFGGGCTGEIVSDQGLILTNHHCGYSNIQKHSSLEHDYLTDGFWAQSLEEELPNPGLSVTFLVRMEDVTGRVLNGVQPGAAIAARETLIKKNSDAIEADAVKGTHYKASVKPLYNGNQYYLFVYETYRDVRLVGAPPSNIGKFGGDTDNWMWPRHTGDFSVFRIYAGKNNEPAEYSTENVPYHPKRSFAVSVKGLKENDFTFVYGYPGSTQEYLPSCAVDLSVNQRNPIAIDLRGKRLAVIDNAMDNDRLTRIQYSAKAAGIANFWKKMIGESRGIRNLDGIDKKKEFESSFTRWVNGDANRVENYGNLLPAYEQAVFEFKPYFRAYTMLNEGPLTVELLRYAYGFNALLKQCRDRNIPDEEVFKTVEKLKSGVEGYFKNYNPGIDRRIFAAMMKTYREENEAAFIGTYFLGQWSAYQGDYKAWADAVFEKSLFADQKKINDFLGKFRRRDYKKIARDPAFLLAESLFKLLQNELAPAVNQYAGIADSLQRIYMKAQMEMQPGKVFYPDANLTLRVAYGQVKGYHPADGVDYRWYTTLEGIMEKENPDIYDYVVESKLKDLYRDKNYGIYGDADGTMHVAFIATNHTTGGNSGSPVLDADGNLVGINFDRCWEGTMSDLMYDPDQCRNIALDIRYCLFIIDRFAGAHRLISEMKIVSD